MYLSSCLSFSFFFSCLWFKTHALWPCGLAAAEPKTAPFHPFSVHPVPSKLQAEARWTSSPRLGACLGGTHLSFLPGFTWEDQHVRFRMPQPLNLARGLATISCLCVSGTIINIRKGKQMETLFFHLSGVCSHWACRTAEEWTLSLRRHRCPVSGIKSSLESLRVREIYKLLLRKCLYVNFLYYIYRVYYTWHISPVHTM